MFRDLATGTHLLELGLFLLLILLNTLLVRNIRRRKSAERALWEHQEHLEDLVNSRSAQLENLNSRLRLDILKRQNTEKALRASQELLNRTFDSLRDSLLIVGAETRVIVDCNRATAQLFGYRREEVVGQSMGLLHVDDESFGRFAQLAMAAIRDHGYLRAQTFQMRRKNGEVFATEHSLMPMYGEDGVMASWVSVIRDVTEERRTQEKLDRYQRKLRALAAELTAVEAKERRAIAAQLHENLGQLLAAAKMKIAPFRASIDDHKLRRNAAEVERLVAEALEQTRSLTYQLSPPILYQLGLEAALQWLSENIERQYEFRVTFMRLGESASLAEESSVFLFSAVRELLINVAKHARAQKAAVRLRWMDDHVAVMVGDNGTGFLQPGMGFGAGSAHNEFGLFNIQERVSDLGGRMRIRSAPEKGAAVLIRLPLSEGARQTDNHYEHQNTAGR